MIVVRIEIESLHGDLIVDAAVAGVRDLRFGEFVLSNDGYMLAKLVLNFFCLVLGSQGRSSGDSPVSTLLVSEAGVTSTVLHPAVAPTIDASEGTTYRYAIGIFDVDVVVVPVVEVIVVAVVDFEFVRHGC